MYKSLLDLLDHGPSAGNRTFALDDETGERLSFSALHQQSERIAAGLASQAGIRAGDRVALLLPNCIGFLTAYFGIQRAGAVAVPVNTRLTTPELELVLQDSGAAALFVHPRTADAAAAALKTSVRAVICVGFSGESEMPSGAIRIESLDGAPPPPPQREPDAAAVVIYTSGTTGRPKGAVLSHGSILFNVESTKAGHGFLPTDAHLLVVPLFHVTGLNTILPTALEQRAKIVLSNHVDPTLLLETIRRYACTTFFGVPTTFYLLTNRKEIAPTPSLRLIAYSGAPMAALTIQRLRHLFPDVSLHNFFGLTETTSVSTVLPDDQALNRVESVGLPPPGISLAVVDQNDRPLPAGSVGELVIKGPSVFSGYLGRPEATEEALRGGWFHTGDLAMLDEEGYLYLRGRIKEMIIVAGENVYPIEVENALCAHPAVQEAAVFGKHDRVLGEVAHAAVVLRPGAIASERELRGFLHDRLATFKMPRTIQFRDSLPRNASGKVVKRELAGTV